MSGPTEIVATCRKAVITGVSGAPEWSELCDKLTFLRYAERWCAATQKGVFVVFAHAQTPLRKAGWMKLFPGAQTVQKVGEFEDCEEYCLFKRYGVLKTLGDPPPKEAEVSERCEDEMSCDDESADDEAILDGKAEQLCKQVENAKGMLLDFPARKQHTEALDWLRHQYIETEKSVAWAESHDDLMRLEEKTRALGVVWRAKKPEYDAKHAAYLELK